MQSIVPMQHDAKEIQCVTAYEWLLVEIPFSTAAHFETERILSTVQMRTAAVK